MEIQTGMHKSCYISQILTNVGSGDAHPSQMAMFMTSVMPSTIQTNKTPSKSKVAIRSETKNDLQMVDFMEFHVHVGILEAN